ncbi:MAG: hypothetical protein AB7E47_16575 [Desulfovibrionaceae bacterium]
MAELQPSPDAPKAARDNGLLSADAAKENVALDKLDLEALDEDIEETPTESVPEETRPTKRRLALPFDLAALRRWINPKAIGKVAALFLLAFGAGFAVSAAKEALFAPHVEPVVMYPISLEGPPEQDALDTRKILIPIFWNSIATLGRNTTVKASHYVSQNRRQPPTVLDEALAGVTDQDLPPIHPVARADRSCPDCLPADVGDLHAVSLF